MLSMVFYEMKLLIPVLTKNGARAWMANHNPLFYMDVINCPCPDPDAGLANLC